jgi:lysosomal alpha-mannosidase
VLTRTKICWQVWEVREGDFFPYASDSDAYWTGYYTSHPKLKGLVRSALAQLRQTELLNLLTLNQTQANATEQEASYESLQYLRRALATAQVVPQTRRDE